MILTVTPNPALDVTYLVDSIEPGAEHRVLDVQERPGGKGINVARVLAAVEEKAVAAGLVFGQVGVQVQAALDELEVPHRLVLRDRDGAQTRRTVVVVDPAGGATSFSEPGPTMTDDDVAVLVDMVSVASSDAAAVVVSGSFPPGMQDDAAARLVSAAVAAGVPALVDAGGSALMHAARAGAVVKPNLAELHTALSAEPPYADEPAVVVALARQLIEAGAAGVVVTLGTRGAVAVCGARAWRLQAVEVPHERVLNATGAGDAFAAALGRGLAAAGEAGALDWPAVLADATALSAAAVMRPVAGEVELAAYRSWTGEVEVEELRR